MTVAGLFAMIAGTLLVLGSVLLLAGRAVDRISKTFDREKL